MPPLRRLGKYILGTRIAFCDNGERMTEQSYETWKDYFPCIGIAILLGARLPNMGELSTETKIHKFFANPIVQGVGVFLALALAFSGKLSQVGTRVCIVLAACVGIWGMWSHVRSKRAAIFLTVVYIAALLWFAKFLTQSTTATAAPHPLITVKIHPSAFPVSVPPRTTLDILPLHPFQAFTDAASQLHEYDNECSVDRPWPSEKEISSKSAKSYEEVRAVEITNHGPGTLESGRIVWRVRYNHSFGGGCMAPPQSAQTQEDVVSIPTLDQGQTFTFVAVNQTDGCAWLLPPDTIKVKMAGDNSTADVSLKIEPISVPNWIGTPFGPTAVTWEGVPTKNPGYGIVRSGANCQQAVPQRATQSTSSPRTRPLAAVKPSADDDQNASLILEYDSLKERYSAVNQSLRQRASDLGGLPVKPEITTALGTAKADLTASELALKGRNWNVATERMERVKKTLNFLESL